LNQCLKLARALLPAQCALCGSRALHGSLCVSCAASLPQLGKPRCSICALPLGSGGVCGECLERTPFYDSVAANLAYAFPIDALIRAFKYRGNLYLAPVLANLLAAEITDKPDLILAMPLSDSRQRERGFNQAHELARHLAGRIGVPLLARGCRKVANTPPQASLPWAERARNVRGAFVCDVRLTGQNVAVVDDVMTTGATLNEVARNLKRAGASRVTGWIVARTLR
jgi:ComF family protein